MDFLEFLSLPGLLFVSSRGALVKVANGRPIRVFWPEVTYKTGEN